MGGSITDAIRPVKSLDPFKCPVSPRGSDRCLESLVGFLHWLAFTSLQNGARFFLFQGDYPNIENVVIPLRAFASEAEADRFASRAREHIKQAAQDSPELSPALEKTAETGNPYQQSLSIAAAGVMKGS